MAVFVDLDNDVEPPDAGACYTKEYQAQTTFEKDGLKGLRISDAEQDIEMINLNRNSTTEVFACYPAVTIITSNIDLNTLDSLSRTCHQIRENLIQFRSQLIHRTLRCSNDEVEPNPDHTLRYRARATNWYFIEEDSANPNGKIGQCASDMVAECRRCKTVVCRNCTIKPPAPILLGHRHRRLCPPCTKQPLTALLSPALATTPGLVTTDTLNRSTCHCATSGIWLCQPCGRGLRSADSTYDSIWRWRTRYGPTLGEGNRSFECGRAQECCAAGFVEEEIDCDAQDARGCDRGANGTDARFILTTSPTPSVGSGSSEGGRRGAGYARHEIEGIGGLVKKKLVRMARVGACVGEYEDERREGRYMVRETDGRARSWCGWCWRVVPGAEDRMEWGI